MNIGNPLEAIPRYAKILSTGIQNKPRGINAPAGNIDSALYNAAHWVTNNRLGAAAGVVGAIAGNQMLGNPIGGITDALTYGLTNFRPDEQTVSEPTSQIVIMQQPGMQQQPSVNQAGIQTQPMSLPGLNEEDRKRQLQYLQRQMATNLITIQGLQQPQGGGDIGSY